MPVGPALNASELGYQPVDADNHYYEPPECFVDHLDPGYDGPRIHVVPDERGIGRPHFGNRRFDFLHVNPTERVQAPGDLERVLRAKDRRDRPEPRWVDPREEAAFVDRGARVRLLDEQGIDAALLLPSWAIHVEHEMRHRPHAVYAALRSFNRWVEAQWGFGADGRIFAGALLSLLDVDLAVEELDRVLHAGARAVLLKPGPVEGRSPADAHYDAFWARLDEAGVPVVLHVCNDGYNELYSSLWGEDPRPAMVEQSAFQWACFHVERPVMDTLAAYIFHNLFGRFPNLRVASIENGSGWVPYLLDSLDKGWRMATPRSPWPFGVVDERPSDIFRRHVSVTPFHEDDVPALVDRIGAERVLFGSDYPHPEGLAQPLDFLESLAGLSAAEVRRVMRDNAAELLALA